MDKNNSIRKVAILGGSRIPFCRVGTNYGETPVIDMMTASLNGLVDKYGLKGQTVGDVALGTVFYPPSEWNLARDAVLKSGLSRHSPGLGIQRACATSLDGAISVSNKIALGNIDVGIAGGVESMSNVTLFYGPQMSRRLVKSGQAKDWKTRLSAWKGFSLAELKPGTPATVEPSTGKSMGQHCEMMAQEWKITRQAQDELALASHQNGARAYKEGFYDDLIVSYNGAKKDNNLRDDTSMEKMAKLKTAFDRTPAGTLTAGNSSPFTDGAASVLLANDEWAKSHGLEVQAYLTAYETMAIDPKTEGLLMAPALAVPRMLKRAGLKLQDFDFYEIHEAFAAQVLCTLKAWETPDFCKRAGWDGALGSIDRAKLNVVGGSVALGHPFGATGARLLASAAKLLAKKGSGRALLSICTGGGMGTVAILER